MDRHHVPTPQASLCLGPTGRFPVPPPLLVSSTGFFHRLKLTGDPDTGCHAHAVSPSYSVRSPSKGRASWLCTCYCLVCVTEQGCSRHSGNPAHVNAGSCQGSHGSHMLAHSCWPRRGSRGVFLAGWPGRAAGVVSLRGELSHKAS